jgi:hypothetical protein
LDTLPPSRQRPALRPRKAKEKLREIVARFFFGRLRTEDGKRVGHLFVKKPASDRGSERSIDPMARKLLMVVALSLSTLAVSANLGTAYARGGGP